MNENRCVCCDASIPEGKQICPVCEKNGNDRPKRNIDRIREMTVEELAEVLYDVRYCKERIGCKGCLLEKNLYCGKEEIRCWLESEVNNE